jgi:FixJ family two-component response regulator
MTANNERNLVVVVDPDHRLRSELSDAIRRQNHVVHAYPAAEPLLSDISSFASETAICIVSEFNLPGRSGLQLQRELKQCRRVASFIFYVASAQVQEVVEAMQHGAETILEKSHGIGSVLVHLDSALKHARHAHEAVVAQQAALRQLKSLNSGEKEVLRGILEGQLNKEIAQRLNLSVRTIEQRRRQVFRKLNVQHPASLAQKVLQASHPISFTVNEEIYSDPVATRVAVPSPELRRLDHRLARIAE